MHLRQSEILLWLFATITVTQCCLKSGGGSSPKKPTTTPAYQSHKLPCTAQEIHTANCRNGGTCYVVLLRNVRNTGCRCTTEWEGRQCERQYVHPDYFSSTQASTGGIVGIVFGCILGLAAIILVGIVLIKRCYVDKKKPDQRELKKMNEMNGNSRHDAETRLPTISENGMEHVRRPEYLYPSGGYINNMTMSSVNTQRLSTMSATSDTSNKQFETAL